MRIDVYTVTGDSCITSQDGEQIFGQVHAALARGEKVELDFRKTEIFASPFFNAAIGPLLRDFAPADLNERLSILELAPEGWAVLRRVIENAKEYFANERVRHAVDTVLSNDIE